jgi:hypothetical protein
VRGFIIVSSFCLRFLREMAAKSCERLGNEINLWTEKLLFMFAGLESFLCRKSLVFDRK